MYDEHEHEHRNAGFHEEDDHLRNAPWQPYRPQYQRPGQQGMVVRPPYYGPQAPYYGPPAPSPRMPYPPPAPPAPPAQTYTILQQPPACPAAPPPAPVVTHKPVHVG